MTNRDRMKAPNGATTISRIEEWFESPGESGELAVEFDATHVSWLLKLPAAGDDGGWVSLVPALTDAGRASLLTTCKKDPLLYELYSELAFKYAAVGRPAKQEWEIEPADILSSRLLNVGNIVSVVATYDGRRFIRVLDALKCVTPQEYNLFYGVPVNEAIHDALEQARNKASDAAELLTAVRPVVYAVSKTAEHEERFVPSRVLAYLEADMRPVCEAGYSITRVTHDVRLVAGAWDWRE